MLRTFKYRLYPTNEQKQLLSKAFGCVRFVYNNSLAFKKNQYETNNKSIPKFDLINRLITLKSEFEFLLETPSQALQQSIVHLDSAYQNFFRRIKSGQAPGFPRFKSKFDKQTLTFPQGIKLDFKSSKIFIPKLKWTFAVLHRKIPDNAKIKTCTISKTTTEEYYISVLFDDGLEEPIKTFGNSIGIDLGIKDFITFDNGTKIQSEKFLAKYLKKLRKANSNLSSKKKGSNNRRKAKLKLAKIHEKIVNCRKDNLHKISKQIIDENQIIFVEDLNVKSMIEKSYSNLARNIADVSWVNFVNMLTYKADLYGKSVFKVNPRNTSKTCSNCLEINNELTLDVRAWQCKHCQAEHDRDVNAARNILRVGQGLPEYNALKAASLTIGSSCL